MKKIIFNILIFGFIGAFLGVLSKMFDIYTTNLGNIFSELSIWILFGVFIVYFSKTRKEAMINVFLFCVGMLISYYLTGEFTHSIYAKTFIIGWSIFSLFSPIFAYFVWFTKRKGAFGKIISWGILLFTLLASIFLFDGPRWYDILILTLLFYILFIRKKD